MKRFISVCLCIFASNLLAASSIERIDFLKCQGVAETPPDGEKSTMEFVFKKHSWQEVRGQMLDVERNNISDLICYPYTGETLQCLISAGYGGVRALVNLVKNDLAINVAIPGLGAGPGIKFEAACEKYEPKDQEG